MSLTISPQIEKLMAERDRWKETAAESGSLEDFEHYKKMRNEVSTLLKKAEGNHYGDKFNDENANVKTVWKTAYEVLGNYRSSFPSQILHNGHLLSNPTVIATEVNNFFVTKIRKLKEEFEAGTDEDPTIELEKKLSKKNVPAEGFDLINERKEVIGLDWICGFSLKRTSGCLSEELRSIY